jgi:hypothetical protein
MSQAPYGFLFLLVPLVSAIAFFAGRWALARDAKAIDAGSRDKRAIGIAAWSMFGAAVAFFAICWLAVDSQFAFYNDIGTDMPCPANHSHLWTLAAAWFLPVLIGWSWLAVMFALRLENPGQSIRQANTTLWVVGALALLPFIYTFGAVTLANWGDGEPKVNFCHSSSTTGGPWGQSSAQ